VDWYQQIGLTAHIDTPQTMSIFPLELEPMDFYDKAIKELISRASETDDSGDAMRFTQAAVNVAKAADTIINAKRIVTSDD
jgi:hypothetical protein